MEEIVHIQGGQLLTKLVRIKLFIYRCYQKRSRRMFVLNEMNYSLDEN